MIIFILCALLTLIFNGEYGYTAQHSFSYTIDAETLAKFSCKEQVKEQLIKVRDKLPSDLTFLTVDVKYDGNHLKVLEFQDGPTAGLRSYDEVAGKKGEIWQSFWDFLATFSKPIWYVGTKPQAKPDGIFSHNDKDRVRFEEFLDMGGYYAPSLSAVEQDKNFIKLVTASHDIHHEKHPLFANYKGFILLKVPNKRLAHNFKAKYPEFLIINEFTRLHLYNKKKIHHLFNRLGLQNYRPWSKIYPKKYSPFLAHSIIKQHRSPYYIIKPINSSRSNGVIIVAREKLDKVLKKLFDTQGKKNIINRINYSKEPLTFAYWKHDQDNGFIIEEYVPSQEIQVNGQVYDPTARMIFVATHEKGKVTFTFLKSFWKLPPLPLRHILIDQHISKYREDLSRLSIEEIVIQGEILEKMQYLAVQALVPLYLGILFSERV